MKIRIVNRPRGEAPEWVRDAWIGVVLPLADTRLRAWRGVGVLSGPHDPFAQLLRRMAGKSRKVSGYAVNAKVAIDRLAAKDAKAAAWWHEHAPRLLDGKRWFVFDAEACEPTP